MLRAVGVGRGAAAVNGEAEKGTVALGVTFAKWVAPKFWVELEATMRLGKRNPCRSIKTIVKQAMMAKNISLVSAFWIPN